LPQKPFTLIEKIICDADLYHLGTNKFKKLSALLKQEREEYLNKKNLRYRMVKNRYRFFNVASILYTILSNKS
jgi:hypothetical protein